MKLEQIEQVITLAETGSFTETARRLYLSQPNLSLSIKQLEAELGNLIFERTSAGLSLTPFGREYLRHLHAVRAQLGELDRFCRQYNRERRLIFSAVVSKCNWANQAFARMIERNAAFDLQFSLYSAEQLDRAAELVQTSVCEVALIGLNSAERKRELKKLARLGLSYTRLCTAPFHIMLGKKNPFYGTDGPIPLMELARYPYVNYGSPQSPDTSQIPEALGLSPHLRSIIQVNTNSALYQIVSTTRAFSISGNTLGNPDYPEVKAFPLEDSTYYIEYGWFKRQNAALSPHTEEFLNDIRQMLSQ